MCEMEHVLRYHQSHMPMVFSTEKILKSPTNYGDTHGLRAHDKWRIGVTEIYQTKECFVKYC
jgi:hypothetical protein